MDFSNKFGLRNETHQWITQRKCFASLTFDCESNPQPVIGLGQFFYQTIAIFLDKNYIIRQLCKCSNHIVQGVQ